MSKTNQVEAAMHERATFETWLCELSIAVYGAPVDFSRMQTDFHDDGYKEHFVEAAWLAWQKRALLSAAPADYVRDATEMVPEAKPVAALSRQQVFDKFYFLEGVVNESYYKRISETAIAMLAAAPQQPAPAVGADAIKRMLSDTDALEGIAEWLKEQELTINIGQVQGDVDEHIESSAGWLLRLVNAAMQAGVQS